MTSCSFFGRHVVGSRRSIFFKKLATITDALQLHMLVTHISFAINIVSTKNSLVETREWLLVLHIGIVD